MNNALLAGGPLDGEEVTLEGDAPPGCIFKYRPETDTMVQYSLAPGIAVHLQGYRYEFTAEATRPAAPTAP